MEHIFDATLRRWQTMSAKFNQSRIAQRAIISVFIAFLLLPNLTGPVQASSGISGENPAETESNQEPWSPVDDFSKFFSGLSDKPQQSTGCVTSGDLVITNAVTCTLNAGSYTFNSVVVQSGGTLRLVSLDNGDTNYTNDLGVTLNTGSLMVDSNGLISANGAGYAGLGGNGRGPGGGGGGTCCGYSGGGGSYGGLGGNGSYAGGVTYGSIQQPTDLGSGGGSGEYYGVRAGGYGGGAIHLVVSGELTVNGALSANGVTGSNRAGAGSGGSLWLEAGSVAGSGLIQANGGNGEGGGGAGGRIALYYDTATFPLDAAHLQTFGGSGSQYGGPGTVFLMEDGADPNGVLQLNNQQVAASQSVVLYGTAGGSATFDKVIVGNNTVLLLTPYNNGNTIYTDDEPFLLQANQIVIDAGGRISSDGQGYAGQGGTGQGPGGGGGGTCCGYSGGGGSYGGLGGNGSYAGGVTYGSIQQPTDLGSGGGSGEYYGVRAGGYGGGAIHLVVSGELTVNGALSVNGVTGSNRAGAGSGGSLWLEAGSVTGSGLIQANGGNGEGGGGAGGRVALYYDTATFPLDAAHLQTFGGSGSQYGGPGTVYLMEAGADPNGVLQLYNQQVAASQSVVLYGTAGGSVTFDKVIVGNNTVLLLTPYNNGNTIYTDDEPFVLNANQIVIDAGGRISSDGQGYAGQGGNGRGPGGGGGGTCCGYYGGGGGYGGLGGNGSYAGGVTYGSIRQPVDLGSGGGSGEWYGVRAGGYGGGAIHLVVSGELTVNGALSVNGVTGSNRAGAGSGGSLWLQVGSIAGSGLIQANGGNGEGGGGAGGRIALYYDTNSLPLDAAHLQTFGGVGSQYGGPGTVYLMEAGADPNGVLQLYNQQAAASQSVALYQTAGGSIRFDKVIVGANTTLLLTPYGGNEPFLLQANSIVIDAGGQINSDGQGYAGQGGTGQGPGGGGGGTCCGYYGGGGSYGGLGGNGSYAGGVTYGSIRQPVDLGSGGGSGEWYGVRAGGYGGGAIHLVVSGELTVNGALSVNGVTGSNRAGAGSGGSLWLEAGSVAGSGLIQANGGNGEGGGGAGGRVALYYDTATFPLDAAHLQTFGGSGSQYGGPGTVYLMQTGADPNGVLQLYNQQAAASQSVALYQTAGGSIRFDKVIVGANTTLLLTPYSNGDTDYSDDEPFLLYANKIIIDNGGQIISDALGYAGLGGNGRGPGGGGGGTCCGYYGGGGGHGGLGGNGSYAGGATYGSLTQPADLGSAGGSGEWYGVRAGGAGGGAIHLVVSGQVIVNGTLSANGVTGSNRAGAGSGGSLWLQVGSIAGSGVIRANGGNGEGGGGAGGRVALYYAGVFPSDLAIQANGGTGSQVGNPGSVHVVETEIAPVDPDHSTITLSPALISANGAMTSLVTVVMRDENDNPIAAHELVLTHNGANITVVPDSGISNNQGAVVFTLRSTTAQSATLQADDLTAGITLSATPILEFVATDPNRSTLAVAPVAATADGVSTAAITVTLKDVFGNPVAGAPVELTISGSNNTIDGQPIGAQAFSVGNTDQNGQVVVQLASTRAETKSIHAIGQQLAITQSAQVIFAPGPVSLATSSFSISPLSVVAGSQQSADVTVILKDAQGNPIPNHSVELTASGIAVEILPAQPAQTDLAGKITAAITSTTLGTATISARDETANLTIGEPLDIEFTTGPTDPASSVEVAGNSLTANGIQAATIRVTLKDNFGHLLIGHDVSLSVSGAGNIISPASPAKTGSDGVIEFTLKSTGAGDKTLTIRDVTENVTLNDKPVVTFLPGPISGVKSRLEVNTDKAPADGVTPINITVIALDAQDNPISGADVVLSVSGSALLTQPAQPTDASGRTTGQVVDAAHETVSLSATVNGIPVQTPVSLRFMAADLSVAIQAPTSAPQEALIQYELTVRNTNYLPAQDALLTLQLPTGLTYVDSASDVAPIINGQALSWELGVLLPNAQTIIKVYAQVGDSLAVGAQLVAQAALTSSSTDENLVNNQAAAETTLVNGYVFAVNINPSIQTTGIGAKAAYEITVRNTGILSDHYDVTVSGLDASAFELSKTELVLLPNETGSLYLSVQINECTASNQIPFSINVTNSQGNQQSAPASINLQSGPVISGLTPATGALLGSRDVTFSWLTDAPSSGKLVIYPLGSPDAAQTYTTPEGASHVVVAAQLDRNMTYAWYVEATSLCGVTTSGVRQLTISNGVSFKQHQQAYIINRDYDQTATVEVVNQDAVPHTVQLKIEHPYEDLIVDFRGSGSIDAEIKLLPGESRLVELAMFAQDAKLKDYVLNAVLTTTDPGEVISDFASIKVHILFAVDYTIDKISTDGFNVSLYRVTNRGQTITDLTIRATDPDTGLPASVYLTPQITHMRIETGKTLDFKLIPLFGPGSSPSSGGRSPFENFSLVSWQQQSDPNAIKYNINGEVNGETQSVAGLVECGDGKHLYPVTLRNVAVTLSFASWYCTNRPNIDIWLYLQQFLDPSKILGLMFDLFYEPQSNVLPHDTRVLLNGHEIANMSNQIPQGHVTLPVDPSYLNTANLFEDSSQQLSMRTVHNNNSHYMSSTGGQALIAMSEITVYICASSQEEAERIARGLYGVYPMPTVFDVEIRKPLDAAPATFEDDGTVQISAYVSDDNNPYVNMYSVDATVKYLDEFGNPTETFKLHDDGKPIYGDLTVNDRFFNARWTPQYGGDIELSVTATLPDGRQKTDVITFFVDAQPDFAVQAVFIERITNEGEPVQVSADIINNGFGVNGPVKIEFRYYNVTEDGVKTGSPIYISQQDILWSIFDRWFARGRVITVKDETFIAPVVDLYYVEVVVDPPAQP